MVGKLCSRANGAYRRESVLFFDIGRYDGLFTCGFDTQCYLSSSELDALFECKYDFSNYSYCRIWRKKCLRDFHSFFRSIDLQACYLLETTLERNEIDILNLETGTGIELEELRTVRRDHPIEREISESGIHLNLCGMEQDAVPERHIRPVQMRIRIRKIACIALLVMIKTHHLTTRDIESETDSTLMQIGLSS